MEKRYQVFISSTYKDLQEERQEVMHALLELDCIPSGMELFPAANEDQWTVIRTVIDECDYYVVIVAGKYGSLEASSGLSYTEKEYRYALEQGKPIVAFLHENPSSLRADQTELESDIRKKLEDFRSLCQTKLCKFWQSAAELGSVVSRSIVQLKKNHPATGWVRANLVPDEGASTEILRLRKQIEALEAQIAAASARPPAGTEGLAGGEDKFEIVWQVTYRNPQNPYKPYGRDLSFEISWNDIFAAISPMLIDDANESSIKQHLTDYVWDRTDKSFLREENLKHLNHSVTEDSFQTIKVQLRALGLITKSTKQRGVKDPGTYWTLTPYGDALMNQLRAMHRHD